MKRALPLGLAAFVVGGGLTLLGFVVAPERASQSYLFGFMCSFTVVLGALFLLLIGHAANIIWFVPIRRPCEAIVSTLPALALLFVPVLFSLDRIYPWTHLEHLNPADRERVAGKIAALNEPGFIVRAVIFFAVFLAVGETLRYWSLQQSRDPVLYRRRLVALGAGGIPLLAIVSTLASFDWTMSLEPTFYSDIYGVYIFAGGFVSALGLVGMLTVLEKRSGRLPAEVGEEHYTAIGRLELAMIIFWTYIGYAQLVIMWIADLPLEIRYYIARWSGGWQWVGVVLLAVHWAIPFFLLLSRPLKERVPSFFAISAWIVLVHLLDIFYLVMPAWHPKHATFHWLDVTATLGVFGACLAVAALRSRGTPAVPHTDPLFQAGLEYERT